MSAPSVPPVTTMSPLWVVLFHAKLLLASLSVKVITSLPPAASVALVVLVRVTATVIAVVSSVALSLTVCVPRLPAKSVSLAVTVCTAPSAGLVKLASTKPLATSAAVRVMGVVVVPSLTVMTMPGLARAGSNVTRLVKVVLLASSALLTNALLSASVMMLMARLISAVVPPVVSMTTVCWS